MPTPLPKRINNQREACYMADNKLVSSDVEGQTITVVVEEPEDKKEQLIVLGDGTSISTGGYGGLNYLGRKDTREKLVEWEESAAGHFREFRAAMQTIPPSVREDTSLDEEETEEETEE